MKCEIKKGRNITLKGTKKTIAGGRGGGIGSGKSFGVLCTYEIITRRMADES